MSDKDLTLIIIILLLFALLLGVTVGKTPEPTRLNPIRTSQKIEEETNIMSFTQNSIFFEWGAESGTLESKFHYIAEIGGGATDVAIVASPVRSGTKSIKFTAESLTAQGRARVSTNLNVTAYYVSYWCYFPVTYNFDVRDYAFDEKYFADGYTFNLHKTTIQKTGGNFKLRAPENLGSGWSSTAIPLGQWVQFQLYIKLGVSTGIYKVWQDEALVLDFVNVDTATAWTRPYVTPDRVAPNISNAAFGVYLDAAETQTVTKYLDDIVVSSIKVPSWYYVGYDWGTPEPPIELPPQQYYYVNISTTTGGQVTPSTSQTVPYGQNFTAVATPNIDYLMEYWTRNGVQVTTSNQYAISDAVAGATYNLVAYFTYNPPTEPDPPDPPAIGYFSINIGTSPGGTTDISGDQTYEFGETAVVEIETIKTNYRFNYYLLNNTNWGSNQTFTLAGAVDTSYTLLPVFQVVPPPLPNEPFIPPSQNVGVLSRGMVSAFFGKAQTMKPLELSHILKMLGRGVRTGGGGGSPISYISDSSIYPATYPHRY